MDRHRLAFRRALHKQQALSERTIEGYVSASGRLLRLCEERGLNLYAGELPQDALDALVDELPPASARRVLRGAVLFLEFLGEQRGLPIEFDGPGVALSRAQLERFTAAAAEQHEPYATFLRMLPFTGATAQELTRLQLDDVTQDEHGVTMRLAEDERLLGGDAEALLLRYLHGWRAAHATDSRVLFPSRAGRALSSSTITRRLRAVQKTAELPQFRISVLSELHAAYFEDAGDEDDDEPAAPIVEASVPPARIPALGGLPPDDEDDPRQLRLVHSMPEPPEPTPAESDSPEPQPRTEPDRPTDDEEDSPVDHDDDFDDEDELESRRRRRRRSRSTRARPTASRPHPNLRKLLGQQGTIYIRRRTETGRLADIGPFNLVDIGTDRSVNTFIVNQLVPVYGPGDYEVYLSPTDTESYLTVPIAEPRVEVLGSARDSARPMAAAAPSPSTHDLWEIIRYFDEREARRPNARESFREFYERKKLEEELERLRQENARLAGGMIGGTPGGPLPAGGLPPLPAAGPIPNSLSDQLAERYLDFLEKQAASASSTPPGPFDNLDELVEFKRKLEAVGLEFGGSSAASERDFIDRMTEFFNSPVGQMVAKRMLGGSSAPPRRRQRRSGLHDAPPPPPRPRRQRPPRAHEREDELDETSGRPDVQSKRRAWAPDGVPEHFPSETLAEAEDADEVLEALVFALMCLNFDERWHDAVQALLHATVADEREQALSVASSIAGALVHLDELDRDQAELALLAVQEQWDELRERVLDVARKETQAPGEQGSLG